MGDHRASIKISFNFHGKTYKMDSWINYSADDDGLDQRVKDFFQESYEDGMARYEERMIELRMEESKKQIEENEKAELERLKAKYEPKA